MRKSKTPPAGVRSAPGASRRARDIKLKPRPYMVNGTVVNCAEWLPLWTGPGKRTWFPADFVHWLRKGGG